MRAWRLFVFLQYFKHEYLVPIKSILLPTPTQGLALVFFIIVECFLAWNFIMLSSYHSLKWLKY